MHAGEKALAQAAGTTPERVLLTSVHQHDAPLADLTAERLLNEAGVDAHIIDLDFHERMVKRVAGALAESLPAARTITHYGMGQARVERVASNRRVEFADGTSAFARGSTTRDAAVRDLPEGQIDPWLKVISFWDGERAAGGDQRVCHASDEHLRQRRNFQRFRGAGPRARQRDDAAVQQIYVSGCSGDVTAGKYNDGSPEVRGQLIQRMHAAMRAAGKATVRHPLKSIRCATRSCCCRIARASSRKRPCEPGLPTRRCQLSSERWPRWA